MKKLPRYVKKRCDKKTIRCWVIIILVAFVVACFVGLVIGLSLGLKKDDDCDGGMKHCDGKCRDLKSNDKHCGKCGNACKKGSVCIDGSCDFCSLNCTTDSDVCSIEPCIDGVGCSTLNCTNDNDACTVGTCDPVTGCQELDCDNVDMCTTGPCDKDTGCAIVDCDALNDTCLAEPCDPNFGCANLCAQLKLNPPNTDFSVTYPSFSTARAIVAAGLSLTSLTQIMNVTVTVVPSVPGETFAITAQPGITTSYSDGIFTLSGSANPSVYRAALRSLTYQSNTNTGTITFTFEVTNLSRINPHHPVTTVTIS